MKKVSRFITNLISFIYFFALKKVRFCNSGKNQYDYSFNVLNSWWNAELDLLDAMEIKLTQLFYKYKKYSKQANWYVDLYFDIFSESDLEILAYQEIFNNFAKKSEFDVNLDTDDTQRVLHFAKINDNTFSVRFHSYESFIVINQHLNDYSFYALNNASKILQEIGRYLVKNKFIKNQKMLYLSIINQKTKIVELTQNYFYKLSDEAKKRQKGKRVSLKIILQARREVKKIKKYITGNLFAFNDSQKEYLKGKKNIYQKLTQILAEDFDSVWD